MTSFAIMVTCPPDAGCMARSALAFTREALADGHQINCLFFYIGGARTALSCAEISSDDLDVRAGWQQLAAQHDLELCVCVGSAQRQGVVAATLASAFQITYLGRWLQAVATADRVLRFA